MDEDSFDVDAFCETIFAYMPTTECITPEEFTEWMFSLAKDQREKAKAGNKIQLDLKSVIEETANKGRKVSESGSLGSNTGEIDTETDISMKEDIESSHTQETIYQESVLEDFEDNEKLVAPAKRISKADRSVVVVSNASNMEAKAAVDDLVEKTENGWICKACGKTTSNRKEDMQKSTLRASPLIASCAIKHSGLEIHLIHINLDIIHTR